MAGVSISTPPAGNRASTEDVLAAFFEVLEASSFVFEAPELALLSADPLDFDAPVLLAGADVIVESSSVAEAFAAVFDAFGVAVGLAVSEAGEEETLVSMIENPWVP